MLKILGVFTFLFTCVLTSILRNSIFDTNIFFSKVVNMFNDVNDTPI